MKNSQENKNNKKDITNTVDTKNSKVRSKKTSLKKKRTSKKVSKKVDSAEISINNKNNNDNPIKQDISLQSNPSETERIIDKNKENRTIETSNGENESIPDKNKENQDLVARTLLRLYQYVKGEKEINEKQMIHDLDFNTPNQKLHDKITSLDLEIQSTYEENQALRESALQTQIQCEEQVEAIELENSTLKEKLREIDKFVKKELEKRADKYQKIIDELREKLRSALEKNEKVTEVSEGIQNLQEQITGLFDQNEHLRKDKKSLSKALSEAESELEELREKVPKLEKRNAELQKKFELQQMVIEGYKRKEI